MSNLLTNSWCNCKDLFSSRFCLTFSFFRFITSTSLRLSQYSLQHYSTVIKAAFSCLNCFDPGTWLDRVILLMAMSIIFTLIDDDERIGGTQDLHMEKSVSKQIQTWHGVNISWRKPLRRGAIALTHQSTPVTHSGSNHRKRTLYSYPQTSTQVSLPFCKCWQFPEK